MHARHSKLLTIALALTVGCSSAYEVPEPELTPVANPSNPAPFASVVDLDSCLTGGGTLAELGAVNNNDQTDHGALLTFGISPHGLVAAAGADGTLKFWTMDDTFVGSASGVLTYGPEIGGMPITDLAFTSDAAVAGDISGLVLQLAPDGLNSVLGGTMPDVPIAAVAFDRTAQRLAHAQSGSGVTPLVVQTLDGSANANVEDTMATITDLAFTSDGDLVVGGTDGTHATLEIRRGADATQRMAQMGVGDDARVIELAAAREGTAIAVVTAHGLFSVAGGVATRIASSDTDLRSVDLTPSGDHAIVVDANGRVSLRSMADGRELASTTIAAALQARIDDGGQRIVVGATDAMLHVLRCQ